MSVAAPGIDAARLEEWFGSHVLGRTAPLEVELIAGGHSNLTFSVRDAAGRTWVMRRPPLGHLLPTAHDMAREHRILSALRPTAVPVPEPVAFCADLDVIGAPFYVMAKVEGEVLRNCASASALLDEDGRRELGLRLVDTLVEIHKVEPAAVGLGDLGRPDGYISRQLRRWKCQLDGSRTRPLEQLYAVHDRLAARIPDQTHPGLVHGDYHLDNCIVGPQGDVRAVLDWELCTQGDTLADVGLLMVYWSAPDDPEQPIDPPPNLAPGFPTRKEMLERYSTSRNVDAGAIDFYVAFGYWRLAYITEGVYARYLNGSMGDHTDAAAQFEQRVLDLASAAARIASGW